MIEVAPELFQCSHCGYGPSQTGYRAFWALSNVEESRDAIDAVCVRLDEGLDCYVMTCVSWEIDDAGGKIEGTFDEEDPVILSTKKELEGAPLPVVIKAKGKWDYPPAKPTLKQMMFEDPLGLKEISLSSARSSRSG